MQFGYPVQFSRDRNGSVIATFRDVPEAHTVGRNSAAAYKWAQDALVAALSLYVEDGRDVPKPSRPRRSERIVALPPMIASKLAIYSAMRQGGVTQLQLASRLGSDARQVRRLLDLDHNSTLPQLEAALAALGKRLLVQVADREAA